MKTEHVTVAQAFRDVGFDIKTDEKFSEQFNVYWAQAVDNELIKRMQPYQVIYTIPGQFNFFRKDNLFQTSRQFYQKNKNLQPVVPQSYILPDYKQKVVDLFINKENERFYIYKSACAARGEGVFLIKDLGEIDLDQEAVLQQYHSDPLLLDQKKFDLRVYVLVLSVDPLVLMVYDHYLVRQASELYIQPNEQNYKNKHIHLTNFSQNKNQVQVDKLKSVFQKLKQFDQQTKDTIIRNINEAIKQILAANYQVLCQNAQVANSNQLPRKCFGFYGFDFLVNKDMSVQLLEINIGPSSSVSCSVDEFIKLPMYRTIATLVKPQINYKDEQVYVPKLADPDGNGLVREFIPKKQTLRMSEIQQIQKVKGSLSYKKLSEYEQQLIQQYRKDMQAKGNFSVLIPEVGKQSKYFEYKNSDQLLYMEANDFIK